MSKKPIVFLDGSSLVYRAFYALPPLQTSWERPTGATLGFFNMLFRLLDTYGPFSVVAAFDYPKKTFRHEMYKEYKAKRKPMPQELKPQLEDVKELLSAMGFPVLEKAGFEGDDLIGSGIIQLKGRYPLMVVTADLDLLQLLDEGVTLLQPVKGVTQLKTIDLETLATEWGIRPHQVVDVLALAGDPSDNIQGVPGIGEKTALKLVREFGSWENIRAREGDLPPRLATIIREHRDRIEANRTLLTIEKNALPEGIPIEEWGWHRVNWETLLQKLHALELKKLAERVQKKGKPVNPPKEGTSSLFALDGGYGDTGCGQVSGKKGVFLFPDFSGKEWSSEEKLLDGDDVWCAPTLLFLVYPFFHIENPSLAQWGKGNTVESGSLDLYLRQSRDWLLRQPELISVYQKVEKALLKVWFAERHRLRGFALYPFLEDRRFSYEDLPLFRGMSDLVLDFDDPALRAFLERESAREAYRLGTESSCFRTLYGWRFLAGSLLDEDELHKRFQWVLLEELRRLSIFILSVEMGVDLMLGEHRIHVHCRKEDGSFLESFRSRLASFLPSEWDIVLRETKDSVYTVLLGEGGGNGVGSGSGCF
ncbi:MAG: 5'-3' exonuclease H3TH domain-containing protein [Atribacterota bacterium]